MPSSWDKRSASKPKGGSSWEKRAGKTAPPTSTALSASDRKKLAWAKKVGAKKAGGGWHNPLTGGLHWVESTAAGVPAAGTAVGQAIENKVYDFAPGLERYAKRYHKHERPPTHFSDIIKGGAQDYLYRWGSLDPRHPHPIQWLQRNSETGFIPTILDLGAFSSALVGGATKAGVISEAERSITLENAAGKVLARPVRGTELSVRLKRGADASLKRIVKNTNRKGEPRAHLPSEWNRAAKLERRRANTMHSGREVVISPYMQASEKLDTSFPIFARGANKQMIAKNLRAEFVTSGFVKQYAQRLREKAAALRATGDAKQAAYAETMEKEAAAITQPKVLDFVDNPTKKMLRAETEGQGTVVPYRESLLAEKGAPLDKALEQRPWQSLLMLHGAEFDYKPLPRDPKVGMKVTVGGRAGEIVGLDERGGVTVQYHGTKNGKKQTWTKEHNVDDLRSTEKELIAPRGQTIEGMIASIQRQLPEGRTPSYQPHEMGVVPAPTGAKGAGGAAVPRAPTRQNLGHLFDAGLIAFNRDLLGRGTLRLLRWAHFMDKHAILEGGGVEIGGALPRGWRFVKQARNERIPYTEQHIGEFNQMLDSLDIQGFDKLADDLTTTDAAQAAIGPNGGRLAVPEGYAKRVIGDFSKSDETIVRFFHNVTAVWRALVLNLRPAWLVNNIVGNTLLYSVQRAGKGGLRAYLSALLEMGMGPDTILSQILGKEFTARLSAKELAEILPDQVMATFMGTQMPEGAIISRTIQHRYSPARWARNLDQNYEKALRKAIADGVLSRNPAVKAIYKAMPTQERSWMAAVRQAVKKDALLPERVGQEVNAALGDFTNMSKLEQSIRSVVPFYAWYKAITVVMLKMPLDSPYRTSVITKMASIGQSYTDAWWRSHGVDPTKLPYYLRSVLPDGNRAWRMTGLNPFTTTPQLLAGAFSPGGGQDLLSSLNPVIFAPLIGMVKAANPAPWEPQRSAYEAAGKGAFDFIRFLPEIRLLFPYKGKLSKGGGTHTSEFLGYMGYTRFTPDFEAIAKRYNGR